MFVFKRNQIIITALVFMVAIAAYLNFTDKNNMVQPTFEDDRQTLAQNDGVTYTDYFLAQEFEDIDTLAPDLEGIQDDEMAAIEDIMLDEHGMVIEDSEVSSENIASTDKTDFSQENVTLTLKDKVAAENKEAQSKTDNNLESNEVVVVNKSYDVNYFVEAKMDREQKRSEQIEILTECVNNKTLDKESKADAAGNLINLQQRIEQESAIEALLKAKGFKEVFVRMSDNDVDVVIDRDKLEDSEIAQIEDIVRRKTGYTTSQIRISPLKN